jgi:hypothetical protein
MSRKDCALKHTNGSSLTPTNPIEGLKVLVLYLTCLQVPPFRINRESVVTDNTPCHSRTILLLRLLEFLNSFNNAIRVRMRPWALEIVEQCLYWIIAHEYLRRFYGPCYPHYLRYGFPVSAPGSFPQPEQKHSNFVMTETAASIVFRFGARKDTSDFLRNDRRWRVQLFGRKCPTAPVSPRQKKRHFVAVAAGSRPRSSATCS